MYLAVASFVFADNGFKPESIGQGCQEIGTPVMTFYGQKTVADFVLAGGHTFGWYGEGYDAMKHSTLCPAAPADCPFALPYYPCTYDPSDVPFEYYGQFKDNAVYMKDLADLAPAITGNGLPDLTFVKALGYKTEHPGYGDTIAAGTTFVDGVVQSILGSPYADDTLILLTWDEGGGFYDHVAPPANNPADNQPYGTRVPLIALGKFARQNTVSHVTLEHSSIVKFLEFNFTDSTGQLGARDANVNNIGSLLDPAMTGVPVP
jgi:phospholipase C